jgi:molybdopterin-guanine dinucleotide biosynthesis protein A
MISSLLGVASPPRRRPVSLYSDCPVCLRSGRAGQQPPLTTEVGLADRAHPATPLSGAVLVGGQSRRMGQDKALLSFRGMRPLVADLVAGLGAVCAEVILVGGEGRRFEGLLTAARWVPDARPGLGPVAGLLTALLATGHDRCLVVACDMPFISAALIEAMAREPLQGDALVYRHEGGFEPLLGVYSRQCAPRISGMLDRGELRAMALIEHLRVQELPAAIIERLDPERTAATNLNTPDAWARAREAERRGSGHL